MGDFLMRKGVRKEVKKEVERVILRFFTDELDEISDIDRECGLRLVLAALLGSDKDLLNYANGFIAGLKLNLKKCA